jgi:hypothetical protein
MMTMEFKRFRGILALAMASLPMGGGPALAQNASVAPPRTVIIPPRPYPPFGAPATLVVPRIGPDGVRRTVNAGLDPHQTVLNLRSAYNVAALNCRRPVHAEIVAGYRAFLTTHAAALSASSRAVDAEFKRRFGAGFARRREAQMTEVYNYFANPTTLSGFCDAALAMSRAAQSVPPCGLTAFASAELPKLESVFEAFFRAFEQYRIDAARWDAQYAAVTAQVRAAGGRADR